MDIQPHPDLAQRAWDARASLALYEPRRASRRTLRDDPHPRGGLLVAVVAFALALFVAALPTTTHFYDMLTR